MKSKKLHLSSLMFFQLCVVGTYVPILSMYFKEYLGFSGLEVGVILSLASVPSILVPFLSAWVVDRIITSRKFLTYCHIGAAILITLLSFETNYTLVLVTYFCYTILLVPTFALVNALIFHNMENSSGFGSIRGWGTIGWVVSSWLTGFLMNMSGGSQNMPLILQLSAFFSIIVIILTLKLPKIELDRNKKVSLLPREALRVIKKPQVILIYLLIFISATTDKFITFGLPLFLSDMGVQQSNVILYLSIGQISEMIMLFTLSATIKKLGFKKVFIFALILQVLRYAIFYTDGPFPLTLFGIFLHGFIFTFFYAAATIYIDTFTDINSRGGVHQLLTLIQVGLAGLIGNFVAGFIAENFVINGEINFKIFWLIPGSVSLLSLLTLAIFMAKKRNK
jgi:MFS family permease